MKEKLQTISVKGIEQAVKEQINMERNVTKPKVSLSFELSRSHLFKFLKAEGKVEETYDFNVSVKVNDTKNETSSEETASDDSSSDNSTNSTKKPQAVRYETVTEQRTRSHTIPLYNIEKNFTGQPMLTFEQHQKAAKRLRWYQERDSEKIRTDKAKNDFESVIYAFRDWLRDDDNVPFVGEKQAETHIEALGQEEQWLEGDGDQSTFDEYTQRHNRLNGEFVKFKERKEEFHARDKAVTKARADLQAYTGKLATLTTKKDWIKEEHTKEVTEKVVSSLKTIDEWLETQSQTA